MPFMLDEKISFDRTLPITLGGHELKLAPLTLRQIIAASGMLAKLNAAATVEANLGLLVDFVMIGLARSYPTLTRDELLDSEVTAIELREAADVVILQAGGKRPVSTGEAQSPDPNPGATRPIGTSSSPSSASI
jgi:hypothetical protein